MNLEASVTIVVFLLGAPALLSFSNFYERYERKIGMVKAALLGHLMNAKKDLIERDTHGMGSNNQMSEKEIYNDFIGFMNESGFLNLSNEYDDMVYYEVGLEKDINRFSLSIVLFVIPVIILQYNGKYFPLACFFGYIALLISSCKGVSMYHKIRRIDKLYQKYVVSKQSFGGYDYGN